MKICIITWHGAEPAAIAFADWLARAAPGESFIYQRGTAKHPPWAHISAPINADLEPTITVYADTPGGAAHKAYLDGLVHLVQRRIPAVTDAMEYLAVRRP